MNILLIILSIIAIAGIGAFIYQIYRVFKALFYAFKHDPYYSDSTYPLETYASYLSRKDLEKKIEYLNNRVGALDKKDK